MCGCGDIKYAKKNHVHNYLTQAALTAALATYIDQAALTAALATYIDQDALTAALADYIDQAALTAALADYVTQTALNAAIVDFVDDDTLAAAIADFITDDYLFDVGRVKQIPTLLNDWEDFGGGYTPARYNRFAGRVWLQGTLKNATAGELTKALILPSDYRPSSALTMRGDSGMGQDCRVQVYTDGGVWFQTTNRAFVCIDGLSFSAFQI